MNNSLSSHSKNPANLKRIAGFGVFCVVMAGSFFLFQQKFTKDPFLSILQNPVEREVRVTLTSAGKETILTEGARGIFDAKPILAPYKLQADFRKDAQTSESVSITVDRDNHNVGVVASGFQNYQSLSVMVDSKPLIQDAVFDWNGRFETPVAYYTKEGGFTLCVSATKSDKAHGIQLCHHLPEGKPV